MAYEIAVHCFNPHLFAIYRMMAANIPHVDGELPAYDQHVNARADPQVEHSFRLMKGGHPFLEVVLLNRAESVEAMPLLSQRQTLAGTVTLNLLEGINIRSISVQVIGELKKEYAVHRFLSMCQDLYSETSEIDQRTSSELNEITRTSLRRKPWLAGRHSWPYSLKLPKGVKIPCDGGSKNFRLPPTFTDTPNKFSIEYHLKVRIKTGFFSSGYKLICPFCYVPLLHPRLPSVLRQVAQVEGAAPPGPDDDPDGWKALPSVDMTGVLFNSRRVEVMCTLSMPLPLSYTRGIAFPIYLAISSTDNQALNLLSSVHAPRVVLTRTMTFTPWQGTYAIGGRGVSEPSESHTEQIASVSFTLIPGGGEESATSRALRGQLVVPEHLVPEFRILNYGLEYSIAIYPFEAVGFSPSAASQKPLLQQNVEIVTAHAAPSIGPPGAPPIYSLANAP